ncbi:hypothetical protein NEOLEDRAFT_1176278 [Neolentinus lepideus HHB14362 ss-1]|uniref:phosphatidylinositol-3,4,5-trisphosphate 3-phosphatase n=1 Tax=Neolentinus lepideus HHB14362 ss-1 TaxID=1314782 RepID=A0A165UGM5_9AGAM|nr:hypothetical protein NEOLEDRAFT_1176278 [Neolentinus lepideus HHB14362 ss-1]
MADFIRRIVSGNKARFKDETLDVELDLAYITDQIIVMGYPATGIEGLYRNRREDAKKFLDHRHGKNYWIFNFCPIRENSYPAGFFDGRVSRYPFPDHHAPPLAILPLVAREIHLWLEGSPDRVAVLHCKAGKGRSGTMACTYLLAQINLPSMGDSKNVQLVEERAEELMDAMPSDEEAAEMMAVSTRQSTDGTPVKETVLQQPSSSDALSYGDMITDRKATSSLKSVPESSAVDPSAVSIVNRASTTSLQHVLDLHTSKRMKPPSSAESKDKNGAKPKKITQGVSIPSQRRWLSYWSLLLAHDGPPGFWSLSSPAQFKPKIRLQEIKIRMHEPTGVKMNLVKAVNAIIDRNAFAKTATGEGQVWVSLARYDDEFVETLEKWEKVTRSEDGDLGKKRKDPQEMERKELNDLFKDGKWDRVKMVRSFARLGLSKTDGAKKEGDEKDGKIYTYTLRTLSTERWGHIKDEIEGGDVPFTWSSAIKSEATSINEVIAPNHDQGVSERGVILDPCRELRVKMYIGQIFMGWFWFIPQFHLPSDWRPTSTEPVRLVFQKKDVDFPLGIGSSIIDVEVILEQLSPGEATQEPLEPPLRGTSIETTAGVKSEPATNALL